MSRRVGSPKAVVTAATAASNSSASAGLGRCRSPRGYSTYVRSGNPPEPVACRTEAQSADVRGALRPVEDPEIHRSIVELGMVRGIAVDGDRVVVTVALTVAGCPLRAEITNRVTDAVGALAGRRPRRRRPHGHDRRGAAALGRLLKGVGHAAPHGGRRAQARAPRRTRSPTPAPASSRSRRARAASASRRSPPTSRSRSRSAATRSPRSTPTCGASRCRACSASTVRRPSSTT